MDIVTFVLARLDERETKARAATPGPWRIDPKYQDHGDVTLIGPPRTGTDGTEEPPDVVVYPDIDYGPLLATADAEHMIANDPPSVLRDVAAQRWIVRAYWQREAESAQPGGIVVGYHATGLLLAVRALATMYAGHADYNPSWAAETIDI